MVSSAHYYLKTLAVMITQCTLIQEPYSKLYDVINIIILCYVGQTVWLYVQGVKRHKKRYKHCSKWQLSCI